MVHSLAKVHSNKSNRASTQARLERKVVFKSVLDSPLEIKWPTISLNLQNTILGRLTTIMDGVSAYHLQREALSRARKRARRAARHSTRTKGRNAKLQTATDESSSTKEQRDDSRTESTPPGGGSSTVVHLRPTSGPLGPPHTAARPPILAHLVFGINEVTKRLEAQSKLTRCIVTSVDKNNRQAGTATPAPPPLGVVLVCKEDVDSPLMLSHLPSLVASCNSSRKVSVPGVEGPHFVKLVPMPKGAESILCEAVGLRRVSAVAVDVDGLKIDGMEELISKVPTLAAPWLSASLRPESEPHRLEPTHIKQLRTTAPKDIRAAKQKRTAEKAEIRETRRAEEFGTRKRKSNQPQGPKGIKKVKLST